MCLLFICYQPAHILNRCCVGGNTVVVRSEGRVLEDMADVLGVFRLVDSHDERPLYKQDEGENFIYFR